MTGLSVQIELKSRLCQVGEKFGYFHAWEHYSKPLEASPLMGGAPAGVFSKMFGIVEFSDGVRRVDPSEIVFCDEENEILSENAKMNNDILIIIYRDNYEDMFRAMNELMNYLVDLKDSMSIDKRRATIDICGHIRVTFRCGDVYKMAGLRPNYYETWSWEADKFLAPSAAKCCGKKMPSLEGIAYIIQKEVKEKKSND